MVGALPGASAVLILEGTCPVVERSSMEVGQMCPAGCVQQPQRPFR